MTRETLLGKVGPSCLFSSSSWKSFNFVDTCQQIVVHPSDYFDENLRISFKKAKKKVARNLSFRWLFWRESSPWFEVFEKRRGKKLHQIFHPSDYFDDNLLLILKNLKKSRKKVTRLFWRESSPPFFFNGLPVCERSKLPTLELYTLYTIHYTLNTLELYT